MSFVEQLSVQKVLPLNGLANEVARIRPAAESLLVLPEGEYTTSKIVVPDVPVNINANGTKLKAIYVNERVIENVAVNNKIHGARLIGLVSEQPNTPDNSDNHGSFTYNGVDHGVMMNLFADEASCAFRIAYTISETLGFTERVGGEHNIAVGLRGNQIQRLGVEILGSRNNAIVGCTMQGDQERWANRTQPGYIPSYAYRSAGYETFRDAKAWTNSFAGNTVSEMFVGQTYQNACRGCSHVGLAAWDIGVLFHVLLGVTDNEVPAYNFGHGIVIQCDRVVYNLEGSYSTFMANAARISDVAVEDIANADHGAWGHNSYIMTLHDGDNHAFRLRFPAPHIDASVIGFPAGVAYSLLAGTDWATGRAHADTVQNGFVCASNYCNMSVSVKDAQFAGVNLSGDRGALRVATNEDLLMAGDSGCVTGTVFGKVDLTGSKNVTVVSSDGQATVAGGLSTVLGKTGMTVVTSSNNNLSTVSNGIDRCFWITPAATAGEVREHNHLKTTGKTVQRAVLNEGGNFNVFDLNVDGISDDAITEQASPTHGGIGYNSYRGVIRNGSGDGVRIRYAHATLDITVKDFVGSGLAIDATGTNAVGSVTVDGAGTGAIVSADNCQLTLGISNITHTALSVPGNNNTIHVNCDAAIVIDGDNNVITGQVDSVTVNGNGNKFLVMATNPNTDNGTGNVFI